MPNGSSDIPAAAAEITSKLLPLNESWLPSQARLLGWLKQKAPSLAELYQTAVNELARQQLPGRSRIIAHCVREIANTLPDILAQVERTRLEYDKRLDEISEAWDRLAPGSPSIQTTSVSGPVPSPREALTSEFMRLVGDLIGKHKATREKSITIAGRLFQANRPENRHLGDALIPILRQWLDVKNWFVARSHENKTDAECDWEEFRRQFSIFERTVLTLGQGFFATVADLDDLIRTATPDQIDSVIAHLGHIEHYRYFFERLEDPAWILPFQSKGIFRKPPPIEQGLTPRWAASEYLVRVADRASPSTVIDVLLEIASALRKESSPNPFVIRDIINASIKLPVLQAARIVPHLKTWVLLPDGMFFWRRLGVFTQYLAEGGKTEEALSLLSSLLSIERPRKDDSEFMYRSVKPRINLSDYRQIIDERVPALVQSIGRPIFDILCDALEKAAKLSRRSHHLDEWDDNSISWCPVISGDGPHDHDDVATILVSALRCAAEVLVKERSQDVPTLLEHFNARRWLIFRRFALHFLQYVPPTKREFLAAKLTERALFNEKGLRPEYDRLLEVSFVKLTHDEKQTILGWIEDGPPDLQSRIDRWTQLYGHSPTLEQINDYKRRWQWERITPLRAELPDDWAQRYRELVDEFGQPTPTPNNGDVRSTGSTEHPSPSQDELARYTPEDLRHYLTSWQPDARAFPRPSRSDLAQVLTSIVSLDPTKYAPNVECWKGLDPTYVHGIIRGFVKALEKNRTVAWAGVLDLCAWVLEQPTEIGERNVEDWGTDSDWSGSRWWIVELLRAGFQNETLGIPFEFREKAWTILKILTNDPDPRSEDEQDDVGRPDQSMHRAVNSIRGRAMEVVMFYPQWVRRQIPSTDGERLPTEAREILDIRLDRNNDSSLAIHSLYGRWFPWIWIVDPQWATASVTKIFVGAEQAYWLAAWNGYICFNDAYDEVFAVLQPAYARAIDALQSPASAEDDTRDLRERRLAAHLMTFYWRGYYPLEEQEGFVKNFYLKANDKIRAEATEFVGRSLARTEGSVEQTVLRRIHRLLEWRLEETLTDPEAHKQELKAFGWCFSSMKFERAWAISSLIRIVEKTGGIDPAFLVLEHLPEYASDFPNEVIHCASLLVEDQSSHVELLGWNDDLRRILEKTREHPSREIHTARNRLIEMLGRLGHLTYRDLLAPE